MDLRDAANRDLLIGLLALQNGLVDQDVLILAFRAWTRDKSRPIAEILAAQGAIDADERALLEGLAAKHLNRHGGDPEKSLAALSTGRSIRASLAKIGDPDIDATLGHVGGGSGATEDDDAERTGTYAAGTAASDGQRFRVLRPHARGGLGAVFVALDAELNREVALKQILDHHADDPTSRTRFVLEAEITGGLEHPGIVPVYGLGNYGDGRPYYAMRFVRGDSLKEAIAAFHADETLKNDPGRRSLALRKLLRRFVDVCNAIDYAHTRGVLHRDIKPANVIVGKHGETLVVDWGLAKAMGKAEPGPSSDERTLMPSSASGSAETLPGSAMGTPAYMSPEQAAGDLDRLGPRSDVYSLGATLYCLLTGKPPFEGDDLGAVLRARRQGDFPPPRTARPVDRPGAGGGLPEGDGIEAGGPLRDVPSAGRRRRAVGGRRAGDRLARAVRAAGAAVGAAEPDGGHRGGRGRADGGGRPGGRARGPDPGERRAHGRQRTPRALQPARGQGQRRPEGGQRAGASPIRAGPGGDPDVLHRRQRRPAPEAEGVRHASHQAPARAREFYQRLEGLLEGQKDRESRLALGRAYRDVGELTT